MFLRKQLALYLEREVKPRRADDATRIALLVLSRLVDWRRLLVIVKPDTLIGWHRQGFRLFWRRKSRPMGRPRIPANLQCLIGEVAGANRTWGEERIAAELFLKLGIHISPRTVRRYMPARPAPRMRANSQAWSTFVRNHAPSVLACDFFVVVTVSTPAENLTSPPPENPTDRRGDEPQFVEASWRGRRRRAPVGSGSCCAWSVCQSSVCWRMR
jgi:putative transposase